MKITKSQIQKLVQSELNESRERASNKNNKRRTDVVSIDVDNILNEQVKENPELLQEGMFSSALKTVGANLAPGGRWVADYTRARGFDELEAASENFEQRLDALESQMASLLSSLGGMGTP